MKKSEFMEKLKNGLAVVVSPEEIAEIAAEYEEHFEYKSREGYTEEEISKKLGDPAELAKEYSDGNKRTKSNKALTATALAVLSIPAFMTYLLAWGAVLVAGATSIASFVTGFCLITHINVAGLIPQMPYLSALLGGISLFGMALTAAIGCYYLAMYVKRWGTVYVSWMKSEINGQKTPPQSKHPAIAVKTAFRLKLFVTAGLLVFIGFLIACYAAMCIAAGSFEPWHVWNWFL